VFDGRWWDLQSKTESFLAVTSHVISNWQLTSHTLALLPYRGRHTAENLKQSLEKVLDDWEIKKSFAIVTDSGTNVVAVTNLSARLTNRVRCFGRTSQLIVNIALSSAKAVKEALWAPCDACPVTSESLVHLGAFSKTCSDVTFSENENATQSCPRKIAISLWQSSVQCDR